MSLALRTKGKPANFSDNQMYSQGVHGVIAASVLSTQSCVSNFNYLNFSFQCF